MSVAAAILGSAAIGAGASLFGSNQAAKANKKALAQQRAQYEANVARSQPYADAGAAALERYKDATGLNGPEKQQAYYDSFQNEPGWEAAQDAGRKSFEASAAARSMGLSGNTLAGLYDYGLKNQWGAYRDRLGDYNTAIGYGQNAIASITGQGNQMSSNIGNAFANIGNANAAGATGVGQAANDAIQNYLNYSRYNAGSQAGSGGGNGWAAFTVPTAAGV
jgi:hypothetical protein